MQVVSLLAWSTFGCVEFEFRAVWADEDSDPCDTCVERCCILDGVRPTELALLLDFFAAVVVEKTREVAKVIGAVVLPIQEHEVVKAVPEKRVSKRIVEQIVRSRNGDVFVSQMRREIVEVIQPVIVDRIKKQKAFQKVETPVLRVMEESVAAVWEVVRLVPQ